MNIGPGRSPSVLHDGLSATNISTCENLCKAVNILFVKLYGLPQLHVSLNHSLVTFRKLGGYYVRLSKYVYVIDSIQA